MAKLVHRLLPKKILFYQISSEARNFEKIYKEIESIYTCGEEVLPK